MKKIVEIVSERLNFIKTHKAFHLAKNAGWIFFDRIFRLSTGLIISVYLSRYLGPSDFGRLNYITTFPLMMSALAGLGLTNILFNEFIINGDDKIVKDTVTTSILLKMLSGVFSYVFVIIISFYINKEGEIHSLVLIASITLLVQCLDVIEVYFQSKKMVYQSVMPKLIAFVFFTMLRAYGLFANFKLSFFIKLSVIELVTSALMLLSVYSYLNKTSFLKFDFKFNIANKLVKSSWPILISEIFLFFYGRIDLIMIKQLSTDIELGKYSLSMRITDVWYFIPIALTTSLAPSIIHFIDKDYKEFLCRFGYLLNLLVSISLFIGLITTLFADQFISLVFGKQYNGVGNILSINIWTGVFVFLSIGVDRWYILKGLQRFVLIKTVLGAVINVLINFLLIPKYGGVGASVATLFAQFIASFVINIFYSKTHELVKIQTKSLLFIPVFLLGLLKKNIFAK